MKQFCLGLLLRACWTEPLTLLGVSYRLGILGGWTFKEATLGEAMWGGYVGTPTLGDTERKCFEMMRGLDGMYDTR